MTLQNSGTINLSDVNIELGVTSNTVIGMNDTAVRRVAKKEGNGLQYSMSEFYGKRYEVIATISSNMAQVNASSLFSSDDWTNPNITKVVIINSSVHVWSYTQGTPGLRTGTGRSGPLEIRNAGYILGHGGQPNSGIGGSAVLVEQNSTSIFNTGYIYGGGGAGGQGGTGGAGYYYDYQNTGEQYSYWGSYQWHWEIYGGNLVNIFINGSKWVSDYGGNPSVIDSGGYRFFRGSYRDQSGAFAMHGFSRQLITPNTIVTGGGAGGSGGWGTGYNASLANVQTNGAGGAGGSTNAGTGGTGGLGGGWGASGATGATGNAGNYAGGAAGVAGGLGGYYISGSSNLTAFNNTGTVLGRYL